MCEEYNGWSNRETWAVALHINNDQGWQEQVHEALTALTDDEGEALIVKVAWTPWQASQAGDAIRENVERMVTVDGWQEAWGEGDGAGLPADLCRIAEDIGSLYRVNWAELGASFLTDISESES